MVGSGNQQPYAVSVAAKIPRSLPGPHIPEVHTEWLPHLSTGALAIAFVGIIEALSIAKAIAHQTQQKLDYNRQIMAEGLANLAGGFFQSLPGSGSLSRSAINFQSGAANAILRDRLGRNGRRGAAYVRALLQYVRSRHCWLLLVTGRQAGRFQALN